MEQAYGGVSVLSSVASLIDESLALEQAGDIAGAFARAQAVLAQAQETGEGEPMAQAVAHLAFLEFRLGHCDRALDLAQEALTWAAPDSPARCRAWLILGHCAAGSGSLETAETWYRQVADLGRRIGDYGPWARSLHNLANGVYFPRGLLDLALSLEQESQQLIRQHHLGNLLRFPLLTTAWICQVTGRREQARAALDELGQILAPETAFWGYHAFLSALLALDEADVITAQELLRRALAVAEKIGEPGLNGITRLAMSRCLRLGGDAPASRAWADDTASLARRAGYQHLLGQALIERSQALWLCGDADGATADLRQAVALLAPLQADLDLARATLVLTAQLYAQSDPAAGPAWLEAVRRITLGGYAFLLEQERALAFPLLAANLSQGDETAQAASAKLLMHLERVPPPALHIRVLGCFEVRQGRRLVPEVAWRHRRAGELFRLLLLAGQRRLTHDQVLDALWPDKPPGAANIAFHQATSALRRALEPDLPDRFPSRYLEVGGGQVSLHLPPGSWLDCEAFEQHVHRGDWQAAVALYQGELLPGDRYAEWAAAPRERAAQLFIDACLALARERLAGGQPREALAVGRRILAIDPWHDAAALVGMRACLALDDRAGALRIYRNLEQALRQDLGLSPQSELRQLYQTLCRA